MKALSLNVENMAQNQFIRGKPIRFRFKLCCITSSERHLLHAEPYCGVDTDLPDTGLGQGADVVLGLIEQSEVKAGSTDTFDNPFTSIHGVHHGVIPYLSISTPTPIQRSPLDKKHRRPPPFPHNLFLQFSGTEVTIP